MNLECGGYDRQMIFVPYQQEPSSRHNIAAMRSIALGKALQRSASGEFLYAYFRDELYWEDDAPSRLPGPNFAERAHMLLWLDSVEHMYPLASYVQSALLAVSLASFGRRYGQQGVLVDSLRHYSKALAQVSIALQDERQKMSDAVLATCKLFVVYEWNTRRIAERPNLGQDWCGLPCRLKYLVQAALSSEESVDHCLGRSIT
jgi:hypothetical protein